MPQESVSRAIPVLILSGWTLLIALGFFSRLQFGLEDDELQHLHMAWRIGQGDVPYRDFFELHPPAWHFAVAPFVRSKRLFSQTPLVAMRIAHTLVIVAIVMVGYFIARRWMSPPIAAWTAGSFLVSSAFTYAWFDFRPDWIALLCLLGAIGLITELSTARAVFGGILIGVAAMLTQKAWFGGVTCAAWMLATVIFSTTPATRRARLKCLGVMLAGAAAPVLAFAGYFAAHGALREFITDTFLLHVGATRERFFGGYLRASGFTSAGLLALAAVGFFTIARNWKAELRAANPRGLFAMLALTGLIAFIVTPAPFEQAYLFMICYFSSILVGDFLSYALEKSNLKLPATALLIITLIFAAIQKTSHDRIAVPGSWLTALAICSLAWRLARFRTAIILLAITAIPIVPLVRDDFHVLRFDDRRTRQAAMYDALDARLGPDEPIITFWPPALPFRRHIGHFPFVHQTILEVFGKQVESEYLSAIETGRVNLVVAYRADMQPWYTRYTPRLDAMIRKKFRPLENLPRVYDPCDSFVRRELWRSTDE